MYAANDIIILEQTKLVRYGVQFVSCQTICQWNAKTPCFESQCTTHISFVLLFCILFLFQAAAAKKIFHEKIVIFKAHKTLSTAFSEWNNYFLDRIMSIRYPFDIERNYLCVGIRTTSCHCIVPLSLHSHCSIRTAIKSKQNSCLSQSGRERQKQVARFEAKRKTMTNLIENCSVWMEILTTNE